jgi:hypothetical protein
MKHKHYYWTKLSAEDSIGAYAIVYHHATVLRRWFESDGVVG